MLAEESALFRGVLLGQRQHGKTDLLRQVHRQLFQRAEGPIPFFYAFPQGADMVELARHFVAAFCRQARAFLMRGEELLLEPIGPLEREMEQPGLPLSLAELAREMLASPAGRAEALASWLPSRFAHREGRPVCLLLDETHFLAPDSPFFASLNASDSCWLLAGRLPFLLQRAGEAAWPVVRLEPFSMEESLTIAENRCRGAGLNFSKPTWQQWFELAGTTPWFAYLLVQAAAVAADSLDNVEQLGRVYVRDLTTGTLGNWLHVRWQRAIPDRRERALVLETLWNSVRGTVPSSVMTSLAPGLWDGLIAEEWAEETPSGPQLGLNWVEKDWLEAWADSAASLERRQARLLEAFLQRAEQACRGRCGEETFSGLRTPLEAKPDSSETIHLSLTIAPRCEGAAIAALEQMAARQGWAAENTDALRLALAEACRNAVQHSNNPGGKLLIDYRVRSSEATLEVFNEGVSFGSRQEESLATAERGTGLRMIRSLMDEVIFQAEPAGCRLIMTKKFHPQVPARVGTSPA